MNYNSKKNRIRLYDLTFLKWGAVKLLEQLQEEATILALSVRNFTNTGGGDQLFDRLAKDLGNIEIMIENAENLFPDLRKEIEQHKKTTLKKLERDYKELKQKQKDHENDSIRDNKEADRSKEESKKSPSVGS